MGADLQEELSEIKALEESEKIADKVCKKLMSMQKIPEFPTGSVPIADAAKIYGREQELFKGGCRLESPQEQGRRLQNYHK